MFAMPSQQSTSKAVVWLAACLLPLTAPALMAADTTVGTGTPASCTAAAFHAGVLTLTAAQNPGGTLSFDCGTSPHTIVVNQESLFTSRQSTLDGGGLITLDGNNAVRLFRVLQNNPSAGVALSIRNISLTRGLASDFGGAVYGLSAGVSVSLDNVSISESRGVISGGAIGMVSGSFLTIYRSRFLNNRGESGGAIASNASMRIERSEFRGNRATGIPSAANPMFGQGGAIQSFVDQLTIRDSLLQQNTAYDGAAIFKLGTTLVVQNSVFRNNTGNTAGAIQTRVATLIEDSNFVGNAAVGTGPGTISAFGGAIQSFNAALDVLRCSFTNNTAQSGGAISISAELPSQSLSIQDSRFFENSADQSGGAIQAFRLASLTISGSDFENHQAEFGGALSTFEAGVVKLYNNNFRSSRSGSVAGAIALQRFENALIENTTFHNNVARDVGGAIYAIQGTGKLTLRQVTTSGNRAALVGTDLYADGTVELENSTLINRSLEGIIAMDAGSLSIKGSVIFAGTAPCSIGINATVSSLGFNTGRSGACGSSAATDVDVANFAMLKLAEFGDYGGNQHSYLPLPGSPLLDRFPCNGVDARGFRRPIDGNGDGLRLCDSGAVERQLIEMSDLPIFQDGFD
jgi:predicted outer membrane repeat protein